MAIAAHNLAKLYIDKYDFTGQINSQDLKIMADMLENTVYGADTRSNKAGLVSADVTHSGFIQLGVGNIEDILFGNVGVTGKIVSLIPEGATEGNIAYSIQSIASGFSQSGKVGDLLAFNFAATSHDKVVRGTVGAIGAKTTTTFGTARNLGLVGATQKLYGILHITAVSGTNPTLDVIIRSDALVGMGSPTTRITFTQATAITSQWATPVSGAIADDLWWQIGWTIGGTNTPSFTIMVAIAIL